MNKILLAILMFSILGCEEEQKEYHISFWGTSIQSDGYDYYPYEVVVENGRGKVLAILIPESGKNVYDHIGVYGDYFFIRCEKGPVEVGVSSYNSTGEGKYLMSKGESIKVQLDKE